jgi:hypothetical protein
VSLLAAKLKPTTVTSDDIGIRKPPHSGFRAHQLTYHSMHDKMRSFRQRHNVSTDVPRRFAKPDMLEHLKAVSCNGINGADCAGLHLNDSEIKGRRICPCGNELVVFEVITEEWYDGIAYFTQTDRRRFPFGIYFGIPQGATVYLHAFEFPINCRILRDKVIEGGARCLNVIEHDVAHFHRPNVRVAKIESLDLGLRLDNFENGAARNESELNRVPLFTSIQLNTRENCSLAQTPGSVFQFPVA